MGGKVEEDTSYRGKPFSERVTQFLQRYKGSILTVFAFPLSIYAIAQLAPSTFKTFNWESYLTIALTCLALVLMMNNQPPELVGCSSLHIFLPHHHFC